VKFLFTNKFKELYNNLPLPVRRKFAKQMGIMSQNAHHPSLHAKKIQGYKNIWEARVDFHYRFSFNWDKDVILLRVIGAHDEVLGNP